MPRDKDDDEKDVAEVNETGAEPEEHIVSTEPEESDDDEAPDANDEPAAIASRKDRRVNRYKEAKEAADRANASRAETERMLQEERGRRIAMEESARVIQQHAFMSQQANQKDPWDKAFADIDAKLKSIINEANHAKATNTYDTAAAERLQGQWAETIREQQTLVTQRELQRRDYYVQQDAPRQAAMQEQRAKEAAFAARIQQEFPDVVGDQRAFQWAILEFQKATGAEGRPNTWDTAVKCLEDAARRFNLRKAPRADEATRRRYSGVSSGGGGGGNGTPRGTIDMSNKALRDMAEARYPALAKKNPALAHKKWAETIGKSMASDED